MSDAQSFHPLSNFSRERNTHTLVSIKKEKNITANSNDTNSLGIVPRNTENEAVYQHPNRKKSRNSLVRQR